MASCPVDATHCRTVLVVSDPKAKTLVHAERDLTDMARALVAVVQAVGPHASMGHVIDVFRGEQNLPSSQPAAVPACLLLRLPASSCRRLNCAELQVNDFGLLLLPAGANTAAVRKRHHEQLPVWGSGSQLTCGSQHASCFAMLPLCCCRVHGPHV